MTTRDPNAVQSDRLPPAAPEAGERDFLKAEVSRLSAALTLAESRADAAERERDEAREKSQRNYEPIKKWIAENAPEAVRTQWVLMCEAEFQRDEMKSKLAAAESRAERMREAVTALANDWDERQRHARGLADFTRWALRDCAKELRALAATPKEEHPADD